LGTCQVDAVIDAAFSGIVGGKCELHKFLVVQGGVSELVLQSGDVGGAGLDVLLRIQKILNVIAVGCARHHLHETHRPAWRAGLDSEPGLAPDQGGEQFPVPSDLFSVFLDNLIVGADDSGLLPHAFAVRVVAVEETVVDVGMFIGSVETVHPTDDLLLPFFVGFHHPGGFAVPYRKGHDLSFF